MRPAGLPKVAALAFTGCLPAGTARAQHANTLTAGERASGRQLLFDGSSLHGWHSYLQSAPGRDSRSATARSCWRRTVAATRRISATWSATPSSPIST